MCAELHCNICEEMGGKLHNEHRYDRVPILADTSPEGKVEPTVQTDRTVANNKLDITMCDNEQGPVRHTTVH